MLYASLRVSRPNRAFVSRSSIEFSSVKFLPSDMSEYTASVLAVIKIHQRSEDYPDIVKIKKIVPGLEVVSESYACTIMLLPQLRLSAH